MSCTPPTAPGYRLGAVTFLYINQDTTNHSSRMYQQARVNTLHRIATATHGPQVDSVASAGAAAAGGGGGGDGGGGGPGWGPTPPPFAQLPRTEFFMTPPGGDVLSRDAELNGVVLALEGSDGSALPEAVLRGVPATTEPLILPPASYGFAVYTAAEAPACM
jgi:hypothetical protein